MTKGSNNNAARIDCVTFMALGSPHRWEEINDFWPDDYKEPALDMVRVDNSWLSKYREETSGGEFWGPANILGYTSKEKREQREIKREIEKEIKRNEHENIESNQLQQGLPSAPVLGHGVESKVTRGSSHLQLTRLSRNGSGSKGSDRQDGDGGQVDPDSGDRLRNEGG
jgi:hypothetical protein